jgi:hypothetical protein
MTLQTEDLSEPVKQYLEDLLGVLDKCRGTLYSHVVSMHCMRDPQPGEVSLAQLDDQRYKLGKLLWGDDYG